jgi:cytochrome c
MARRALFPRKLESVSIKGVFMKRYLSVLFAAMALAAVSSPVLAQDAQKLLKEKACLSCHTVDKKLVGPAYKDVAVKYKGRKDAVDYLTKKIREGSTGVWGPVPMPPNATVTEPEAQAMAKYIMSIK